MTFNKTKRTLEKTSSIIGIVLSSIAILGYIALLVIGIYFTDVFFDDFYYVEDVPYRVSYAYIGRLYITLSVFMIAFSILVIVFSSILLKSPINADGTLKNRKKYRICMLIFTILSGNWISSGFMIAVLCCNDYVVENGQSVNYEKAPLQASNYSTDKVNILTSNVNTFTSDIKFSQKDAYEFYSNLVELKHLKEIGVIEEEVFKNAVEKVVNNILAKL